MSLGKGLQCMSHDGQKGAEPRALGQLSTPQSQASQVHAPSLHHLPDWTLFKHLKSALYPRS